MVYLHSLITDDTNLIELYVTPLIQNKNVVNINVSEEFIKRIKNEFQNFTNRSNEYITYYKADLIYTYDGSNDNQIVSSKYKQNTCIWNKQHCDIFGISYKHSKLPTHVFPCVSNIDYKNKCNVCEIKLTNRINIIIKNDEYGNYVYIEYKHSPQVEIEKIEIIINKTIETLSKIYI